MKIIPTFDNIDPKIEVGDFAFGLEIKVSDTAMDKLWEYISIAKEDPSLDYDSKILGGGTHSFNLNDTDDYFFNNTCLPIIEDYKKTIQTHKQQSGYHQQSIFKDNVPYALSPLWVNFQSQHEFQPIHNHSGIYSFVIFMQIPYDWRTQHKPVSNPLSSIEKMKFGNFEFVYVDILGNITGHAYQLDSSCEGTMLFFPSEVKHLVYPFYNCEEERITIAGNIVYDI